MKVSYNWLKEYIDIPESPEEISKILTDTGLEVEGLEPFESIEGGLRGLVIGEVITCVQHPNADRLKATSVDVGESEHYPIVCGAPNVEAGQKVVVALPGTTLYPSEGEAFKIKKSKIRGEVSMGMICAEDEIGLGSEHDGILVLQTSLPNGTPASDHFQIENDSTIEIGLTPNRGDAASHLGVARDIRAVKNREIRWPSVENFSIDRTDTPIEIVVEDSEACPRYSGICITGVNVTASPEWLQNRLKSIGLSPINNVVDVTNFVLHETGQPMHAFDYDKIDGHKVIVKKLPEGTPFTTLDEKERKLSSEDLMICDGNEQGMCIGGVFGGVHSGVTTNTRNVFLEVAYFSPSTIRRTATHHGLKTDASFHYERGTDPEMTVFALKRASALIREIAGGEISSDIIDVYPEPVKQFSIPIKWRHIDRLIGKELDQEEISGILERLDINVTDSTDEGFKATVPAYRSDVTREADVIEEILRIHGFNNVELPETLGASYLAEYPEKDVLRPKQKVSEMLVGKGFFEIMTNSLTKESYTDYSQDIDPKRTVHILNKLSEDLGVLKQTMLFNALESVAYNINRKQENIKFFEFGRTYEKNGSYVEAEYLTLLITGNKQEPDYETPAKEVSYYDLAGYAHAVLQSLGLSMQQFTQQPINSDLFLEGIELQHDGKSVARLGQIHPGISNKFEIKSNLFYAELTWGLLLNITNHNIVFEGLSKFPPVKRDLSLVIDQAVTFSKIEEIARATEPRLLQDLRVFDVYEGDRIEKGKKAYAITFILQDADKTLTDKIIDKTMNRLMKAFQEQTGALIRQ